MSNVVKTENSAEKKIDDYNNETFFLASMCSTVVSIFIFGFSEMSEAKIIFILILLLGPILCHFLSLSIHTMKKRLCNKKVTYTSAILTPFVFLFFSYMMSGYSDKPIKQLYGIEVGKTLTEQLQKLKDKDCYAINKNAGDFEWRYSTVFFELDLFPEVEASNFYSFQDDDKPETELVITTNNNDVVTSVLVSITPIAELPASEVKERLKETLMKKYGDHTPLHKSHTLSDGQRHIIVRRNISKTFAYLYDHKFIPVPEAEGHNKQSMERESVKTALKILDIVQ